MTPVLIIQNIVAFCEVVLQDGELAVVNYNGVPYRVYPVVHPQNIAVWQFDKDTALDLLREVLES